ncbi:hypothetical protein KSP40_PGU017890 [Platanthera guangdongensis]|uniref:Uncharacterized protein n=1 Tax=Platanthera guangdongensis TaxID=2320717 RepID=A0ABR2MUI1_9ASPA
MDLDFAFEGKSTSNVGPRSKISISLHTNGKKAEGRDKRERHLSTYDLIDKDYDELLLYSPASPHRKSMPSRSTAMDLKDSDSLKRGSMYRSSKEVGRIHNVRDSRNVEPDHSSDAFLSFEVIDSSPWDASKEVTFFPQPTKVPKSAVDSRLSRRENHELLDLSFRDLSQERSEISISCLPTEERGSLIGTEALEKMQVKEIKFSTHQLLSAGVDTNIVRGKNSPCTFSDPFSAKVGSSNTSCHAESGFLKTSSKTRFSSFKKMLDPIMKSKSLPKPIILEPETNRSTPSDALRSNRLKFFPKSLMNDFSRETRNIESVQESTGSDQVFQTATSLACLHAVLKWAPSHDPPLYEFFVKDPEDVLCAKIWKTENSFNWAYTFHRCKKRSKGCSLGKKDRDDLLPSLIAQMQVSCYLCSDVSGAGLFDNSAVTEFTLYDIDLARRNHAVERYHLPLSCNQTAIFTAADCPSEVNSLTEKEDYRSPVRHDSSDFDSEPSTSYPWAPSELKPNLEIAAIVIQIPFIKKGNLKILGAGDKYSSGHQKTRTTSGDHSSFSEVKVVTPMGRHGVPNSEEFGPSSLLDRWRFGGGCECGGWDMGCPILVFDTVNSDSAASVIGTRQPIVLLAKVWFILNKNLVFYFCD